MPKNITKEEFQAEAVRRMQALHLHPFVISKFKDYGTLCCSEVQPPIPRITALTPELEAKAKWIEEKYHGMAYHVIRSETTIGEMYSFLYISPYREDWEVDERCIVDNLVFTYVWNKTWDMGSEFGTIPVVNMDGLLIRTA